jgi:hypothetical protein
MKPMRRSDPELAWVVALAGCISVLSCAFFFRHGEILLYGDAVAHINIARRVFDSRTPGLLQLGTVWLPLPHLLMIPFLFSDSLWRTGWGGSIPSIAAYVAGGAGLFRLVRSVLSFPAQPDFAVRISAWLAVLVYAANPNLIYLQSTAMTEAPYLALMIWTVIFFNEFLQQRSKAWADLAPATPRSLVKCTLCVAGAELTRYDGWFLAAAVAVAATVTLFRREVDGSRLRRSLGTLMLTVAAAPLLWLAYNGIIYRNPLEFANGPYSARAIQLKTAQAGFPAYPGSHNPYTAAVFFLKTAELNVAEGRWQKVWVAALLAGSALIFLFSRRLRSMWLLWVPLLFYPLSIAYGGVPIYLPVWWPFSFYNVRYGIQLLPAFAVSVAVISYFLVTSARSPTARALAVSAPLLLMVGSYAAIWRAQPVCLHEAWVNSRSRLALETELARQLKMLPSDSTILMYLGDHSGALQQAGIPLRRVIQEGNHRTWKQPVDPDGLWERALADPSHYADYIVAIAGDPVATSPSIPGLRSLVKIHTTGQPEVTIYSARQVISRVNGGAVDVAEPAVFQ